MIMRSFQQEFQRERNGQTVDLEMGGGERWQSGGKGCQEGWQEERADWKGLEASETVLTTWRGEDGVSAHQQPGET